MKKFTFVMLSNLFLILNLNFYSQLFAQWGTGPELVIRNLGSQGAIDIKFYPVGAVYNFKMEYSPLIRGDALVNNFQYLVGFDTTLYTTNPDNRIFGQFEGLGHSDQCQFAYGLGLYKIEFYISGQSEILNYCFIDWRDANVYLNPSIYPTNDLAIDFFNQDSVNFFWAVQGNNPPLNIDVVNKYIKLWELKGSPFGDTAHLVPSKGLFTLDTTNATFLKIPINYNKYNGNLGHENPGDLGMNIEINDSVTTRDTLSGGTMDILIPKKGYLKINPGKTFNMIHAVNGYNNLIIQDSSELRVLGELIVGPGNSLTLKNKGKLIIGNEVLFKNGSYFCNEGGIIEGRGSITVDSGYFPYYCVLSNDYAFSDSVKLILKEGVTLEIPDSVTLSFTGIKSGLIMNPNSKLKLGVGSKILFKNCASLIAGGATFTSLDSTKKWEGIVFLNSGIDSITDCTFNNAKTALTFRNDYRASYNNRVIKNNTFNVPSGDDYIGIYGENNNYMLIQDNTFNMTVAAELSSPYYTGIYLKNISDAQNITGAGEGPYMLEDPGFMYSLNIVHNTFNNGSSSIVLANYLSNLVTYYIKSNVFNSASVLGLLGMQIDGNIKDNTIQIIRFQWECI